jgi:probable rRNA maturation factor
MPALMMEDPEQPPSTDVSHAGGAAIASGACEPAGVCGPGAVRVDVGVAEHVPALADGDRAALVRFAVAALGALGHSSAELSVLLCDDRFIRELNLRFRGIDAPTDVLSFEQDSRTFGHGPILGDVVISLDTARRQARRRSVAESAELRELLLHGILHLLGRDHGDGDVTDEPMLQEQRRLLECLSSASWTGS